MRTRVVATGDRDVALGPFSESESLLTADGSIGGFALAGHSTTPVADALGEGQRTVLTGRAGALAKEVEVTAYAGRPRWLFLRVRYRNEGTAPVEVDGYASDRYEFGPGRIAASRRSGRTRAPPTSRGRTGCCRSGRDSSARTTSA
jgi:hypothetical protein